MRFRLPLSRALVPVVVCATLFSAAACHGRNDGGRDAAGGASNGAGPAPQPGDLAGESKDTTTAPPGTPAPAAGAQPASSAAAPAPAPAAPAAGATKRP